MGNMAFVEGGAKIPDLIKQFILGRNSLAFWITVLRQTNPVAYQELSDEIKRKRLAREARLKARGISFEQAHVMYLEGNIPLSELNWLMDGY